MSKPRVVRRGHQAARAGKHGRQGDFEWDASSLLDELNKVLDVWGAGKCCFPMDAEDIPSPKDSGWARAAFTAPSSRRGTRHPRASTAAPSMRERPVAHKAGGEASSARHSAPPPPPPPSEWIVRHSSPLREQHQQKSKPSVAEEVESRVRQARAASNQHGTCAVSPPPSPPSRQIPHASDSPEAFPRWYQVPKMGVRDQREEKSVQGEGDDMRPTAMMVM